MSLTRYFASAKKRDLSSEQLEAGAVMIYKNKERKDSSTYKFFRE